MNLFRASVLLLAVMPLFAEEMTEEAPPPLDSPAAEAMAAPTEEAPATSLAPEPVPETVDASVSAPATAGYKIQKGEIGRAHV